MAQTITKTELQELGKFFSVKNFIADLPRMLNDAFTKIYNCIIGFYDPDTETLTAQRGNIDYVVATTIVAQNLRVGDSSANFTSLIERIENIENKFNNMQFITKDMIDSGIDTSPYYIPDSSIN